MHKYTLQNLIHINNGMDYRHLEKGSIPVYGSGGYMTSVDQFLHEGESILLPRKGSLDNIMFVDGKFWTVDTMYWATVNTKLVNAYYLYNLLKILDFAGVRSGSTLPSMTSSAYYNIPVTLPDVKVQDSIANILKGINSKIELNDKINTELETIAKDLYNYWFVQFDFPDKDKRPYKSSGGKMVYNDVLKREIPDGWDVKSIKDFCNVITGKEDANFATTNGIYPFFTCGDEILKCDKSAFEGKAILIAGNGNFNVKYNEGKFNAYQRTYVLIPTEQKYVGIMYRAMLDAVAKFTHGSNGSIVKFITKGDIENTYVIVPNNVNLLDFFNGYLSQVEFIKKQTSDLVEIRNFLLPMLMNGQVSVS